MVKGERIGIAGALICYALLGLARSLHPPPEPPAHAIAARNARGEATTEDLRQAMIHYRALFEDLLGAPETRRREAA